MDISKGNWKNSNPNNGHKQNQSISLSRHESFDKNDASLYNAKYGQSKDHNIVSNLTKSPYEVKFKDKEYDLNYLEKDKLNNSTHLKYNPTKNKEFKNSGPV